MNRLVYQNYLSPTMQSYTNSLKKKNTDTVVSSELEKEYYMFEWYDDTKPFGYFPTDKDEWTWIPIWDAEIL